MFRSSGLFLLKSVVFVCVFWSLWIFLFRPLSNSLSTPSTAQVQDQEQAALMKKYWDQAHEADRIQAKYKEQVAIADGQLKRMDAVIAERERQLKRLDAVIAKWEKQAGSSR